MKSSDSQSVSYFTTMRINDVDELRGPGDGDNQGPGNLYAWKALEAADTAFSPLQRPDL
jgi:hypothetical protein